MQLTAEVAVCSREACSPLGHPCCPYPQGELALCSEFTVSSAEVSPESEPSATLMPPSCVLTRGVWPQPATTSSSGDARASRLAELYFTCHLRPAPDVKATSKLWIRVPLCHEAGQLPLICSESCVGMASLRPVQGLRMLLQGRAPWSLPGFLTRIFPDRSRQPKK